MGIGQNFLKMIQSEAGPIFLGILIVVSMVIWAQKKVSKLIGFILVALFVGGIIFAPQLFESFSKSVFSRLLGG